MSDWDASDDEASKATASHAKVVPKKNKWEDEDKEEDAPASDWEESSESEEEEKPAVPVPVAAPRKKGTLKQKLAEKEAQKAAKKEDDDVYDSDDVLDPREKARRDHEKELKSDLNNAAELFGAAALGGTSSKELDNLISCQPHTKDDFIQLSNGIIEFIVKRHQNKPLYTTFVEHHVRALATPLRDVEVRKAASVLTTLANEKQKEQRDKASGKKKKPAKPALGSAKVSAKVDTSVYDEALDDFGSRADEFM